MLDPTVDTVGILVDPVVDAKPVRQGWRVPFRVLQLIAAVVVITYAAILWTLPRGFDLTDEAFVYAMISSNRVAVGEPWGFQHLLHPLYVATGESVLVFRFLRLAGYVLLSLVLVRLARVVVNRAGIRIPRPAWTFIFLFAQVGTFLAWSYPPRYLGYNELASWFAQLGIALLVLSLTPGGAKPSSRMLWSLWAGLGAITSMLVFTRVSSGVAFALVLALALLVPTPQLRPLQKVLASGAGAMTVLFGLLLLRYPVGSYLGNAFTLLFDRSAQVANNHSLPTLIQIYVNSLVFTGRALVPVLLLFALTMATFHRTAIGSGDGIRRRVPAWLTWTLAVGLLIALVGLPRRTSTTALAPSQVWLYLGTFVVFIGAAGLIGLAMVRSDIAATHDSTGDAVPHGSTPHGSTPHGSTPNGSTPNGSTRRRSWSVAVGVLAVVAAPFISAVGTNNGLAGQLVFAATLWAVVLGIALVLLTHRASEAGSSARSVPMILGLVVVLLAAVAVKGGIDRPYRTTPLLAQETSTSVPELRGMRLNKADAEWLSWVNTVGRSLGAQGVPATAISSPAALFVFNHSGYAAPWLDHRTPVAMNSLRKACTTHPPSDLFVLQPASQTADARSTLAFKKSLSACGIRYSGDFEVVDRTVSADPQHMMTIWRLKGPTAAADSREHSSRGR
jgi:hypothetical protein